MLPKTETALQYANSSLQIDTSLQIVNAMQTDPNRLLQGKTPRLLDEWQEQKELWNYVRRAVDDRREKAQFILTGSATPVDVTGLHSGVGRFAQTTMRTMTWSELGWSKSQVSLSDIIGSDEITSDNIETDIAGLCEKLMIGGWPANIGEGHQSASEYVNDYLEILIESDINRVDNAIHDPIRVRRLLETYARNISTETSVSSLAKDVSGSDYKVADETVATYIRNLEHLMVIENLPTWNTHLRSSAKLRKTPKRHFSDPSLAVSALGLSHSDLYNDLEYLGLLFESLVLHDLRVYTESIGGKVYGYRDSSGREVDAIIELRNKKWLAVEIKIGIGQTETAAKNLLRFANNVNTEKVGEPLALVVITLGGFAHRRSDGVKVIPFSVLGTTPK